MREYYLRLSSLGSFNVQGELTERSSSWSRRSSEPGETANNATDRLIQNLSTSESYTRAATLEP